MMLAFFEYRKPETAETIPGLSLQDTVRYAVDSLDDVIICLGKINLVPKREYFYQLNAWQASSVEGIGNICKGGFEI